MRGLHLTARAWRPFVVVFIASACVMVTELVASRLIAQHVGTNLYTWTSIIAVVLAGLAVGNLVGGLLADRRPLAGAATSVAVLLVAAAGLALASVVAVGPVFVSPLIADLALPLRTLAGVSIVFFLPAVVLGGVTPLAATWAIQTNAVLGATVGGLYAAGSLGAIVGTLLTGFVLISTLGSVAIMVLVSVVLAATALLVHRSLPVMLAALFVTVVAAVLGWGAWGTVAVPVADAAGDVIYAKETRYQNVSVAWDPERDVRTVVLDNLVHGFVVPSEPTMLLYPYIALYASAYGAHRARVDRPLRSLHLGGGAFTLPRFLAAVYPDDEVVVAEIDPGVTEANHVAARLSRPPPFVLHHADAREVVRALALARRTVDVVFADAFADYAIPVHLVTVEFYRELDALLEPTGMVLQNVIDDLDSPRMLAAIVATVGRVHPYVTVVSPAPLGELRGRDTFIVVSSRAPIDADAILERVQQAGLAAEAVGPDRLADALDGVEGVVLTDDFTPVERLLLPLYRSIAP